MSSKQEKPKSSLIWRLMSVLFAIAVVGLLVFNVNSIRQVAGDRETRNLLNASLETEEERAAELALLEIKHKRVEAELHMMELGLRNLYKEKCSGPDEFVPLCDDRIVTHSVDQRGLGRRSDYVFDVLFSVPKAGGHRLQILARKASLNFAPAVYKDPAVFSKSYPLEPGNHQISLFKGSAQGKVRLLLDGEKIEFDYPFTHIDESRTVILGSGFDRTVMVPNQLMPRQRTELIGVIEQHVFCEESDDKNLQYSMGNLLDVQVAIESDGPIASLADDLEVVRKLLEKFTAGTPPKFTYNPEGWYEFEE